ncbi:MAG: type 1 glutamine amidotransferase [Pirellulales bacterium]
MVNKLTYLLLQVRNPQDPMRRQEVDAFARALHCTPRQIEVVDMLTDAPTADRLRRVDVVLLGGSGDYSATGQGSWLDRTLDSLRELERTAKPTFASCWGFQAMARALGGEVAHDLPRAELGTIELFLTDEGLADPVFAPLGRTFRGQAGHEDHVVRIPPGAVLLASSAAVQNQAYRLLGKPIYCTQFHPELNRNDLLGRLRAYPRYVERIAGISFEEFGERCEDTPQTEALLRRFVRQTFGE